MAKCAGRDDLTEFGVGLIAIRSLLSVATKEKEEEP